jgi:hypothetical protein
MDWLALLGSVVTFGIGWHMGSLKGYKIGVKSGTERTTQAITEGYMLIPRRKR